MADLADEEPEVADMVAARLAELGEVVEPLPWCRWAWRAWHDLTHDRQWRGGGMGSPMPCNIPWTAARTYATDHGHDLPTLWRLLQALDGVYAKWWAEQAKEAAKKKPEE